MASSHQSPLLWIPLKQTDDVDLSTAVASLISTSYGEDPKAYSSSIHALARARTDAVRSSGSEATSRDLLYKWFHILEMLEVRFPEVRVQFNWKDSFTGAAISQYSLAYEKAGVIFNTAATLSMIAAAISRLGGGPNVDGSGMVRSGPASAPSAVPAGNPSTAGEGDGTKRAYTALRQAAGFLTYINDNFLHAPSTDMSRNLLRFLVPMLLTQANEVFLEKTMNGKSSPGLVSKLASGVAAGYTTAAEESKEWQGKEVVDRTWTLLLSAKAKHFSSVAQHYRALADGAASNHGHSLVRWTLAETLSKEALKLGSQFNAAHTSSGPSASAAATFGYTNTLPSAYTMPSDAGSALVAIINSHLAIVSEKRQQAIKDNDLIYHDILPSESTLPPVEKTSPAAVITIQEVYSAPEVQRVLGPDLFAKLVPMGVHERASLYSEEKAKLARSEAERCDLAEGERVATLEGMGLPGSLEKFRLAAKGGDWESNLVDPGPEVMAWSEEEARGGPAKGADPLPTPGARGVAEAFLRIASLREQAVSDLQAATEALDEESRLCEKARVKIGHSFGQGPSGAQPRVKDMRREIKDNREALRQAEENDLRIQRKWQEVETSVRLLGQGRGALEQAFAERLSSTASSGQSNGASAGVSLLDLSENEEEASTASFNELKSQVEAIDAALVKLSKVKKERDSVLTELRQKLQTDDIGHLLILSHRGGPKSSASGNGAASGGSEDNDPNSNAKAIQEAALFRQELEKFRPWTNRLGQAIAAQGALLAEITRLYQSLTISPQGSQLVQSWNIKAKGRDSLVRELRTARDGNAEVRAALGKGLSFWSELGQISKGLKTSAGRWKDERAREREGMEREADWQGRLGGGSSSDRPSTGPLSPSNNGGLGGLERSMGSIGLGGPPAPPTPGQISQRQTSYQSSYSSPSPAPAPPSQPQSAYNSGSLPPPPPRPYTSSSTAGSNSYYGAGSVSSPAPASTPSYGGYASPPPSTPSGYSSYQQQRPGGPPAPPAPMSPSYPTSQPSSYYGGSSGGPPPPPAPQQGRQPTGYGYQPSSGGPPAPSNSAYGSYGPSPNGQQGQGYSGGYGNAPYQQQQQQQPYQSGGYAPPPPQQQQQGYGGYPASGPPPAGRGGYY